MSTLHNINDMLFSVNEFIEKFAFNRTFFRLYSDLSLVNDALDESAIQAVMNSQTPSANTTTVGYVTYNNLPVSDYTTTTTSVLSLSSLSAYIEDSMLGSFTPHTIALSDFHTDNLSSTDVTLSGTVGVYTGSTTLPTGLTIETGSMSASGYNGPVSEDLFGMTPVIYSATIPYVTSFAADTIPNVFIQIIDNLQTTVAQGQLPIPPSDRVYQYSITSTTRTGFSVDVFYKTDNLLVAGIESGQRVFPGFIINWCATGVK